MRIAIPIPKHKRAAPDSSAHHGHSKDAEIRVLIENSEYRLRNHGDVAMMAVTVQRIRERWPRARIGVLTDVPALVSAYFPTAEGITPQDRNPWGPRGLGERLAARLGQRWIGPPIIAWIECRDLAQRKMAGARRLFERTVRHTSDPPNHSNDLCTDTEMVPRGTSLALRATSLVLCLGGGYLTDADNQQTRRVMNIIELADQHNVPVALVGQGIGPLVDPALVRRTAEALPSAAFVALRERLKGPHLLEILGVPANRMMASGDDAIELAYNARSDIMGTNIGFCLRVSIYSPVPRPVSETVGRVTLTLADEFRAGIVPLIISECRSEDRRSTLPLVRDAPRCVRPLGRFPHPRAVAQQVSTCRVLVTGAYHLAVFALSQGIPVVALSSTAYYDDKFLGLADMFDGGVDLVRLDNRDLDNVLTDAIRASWLRAPELQSTLRARAIEQIHTSRAAFDRVFDLVESSRAE